MKGRTACYDDKEIRWSISLVNSYFVVSYQNQRLNKIYRQFSKNHFFYHICGIN